jgi:hypothetical protein
LAALPLLAGVALAGQLVQLSDKQMDKVTAGWSTLITLSRRYSLGGVNVAVL